MKDLRESWCWLCEDFKADAHWLIPMYLVMVAVMGLVCAVVS